MTRSLRGPCCMVVRASPSMRARVARRPTRSSPIERVSLSGDGVDDRTALQPIRADPILQVEIVRLDLERHIAALRGVVVVRSHDVDW